MTLRAGWTVHAAHWARACTRQEAKDSARDAWHRVERAIPGDADKDGR